MKEYDGKLEMFFKGFSTNVVEFLQVIMLVFFWCKENLRKVAECIRSEVTHATVRSNFIIMCFPFHILAYKKLFRVKLSLNNYEYNMIESP